ncbi:glycosyltransferase [Weissella confusa]|uniref:glycosyltransferase n=1 Tax=Weissella confusa TaxID=1583 RepID=UPI00223C2E5E|nr:glycosyltransferase [Weissella confusa]MCT0025110.1 glycosyltransferase [Weissella confusa]
MKKVLVVAATVNMIRKFNQRNILILQKMGLEVHVASNFHYTGSIDATEIEQAKEWLTEHGVIQHHVPFERGLGTIKSNYRNVKEILTILGDDKSSWAFMHAHTPLGGVLTRIVGLIARVPVMYTAHGFHFFKKSPKKNWLISFPVEWLMSWFTNTLITINEEDYIRAQKRLHAKRTSFIPGVGVDIKGALSVPSEVRNEVRVTYRQEFGLSDDDFAMLSVGELNANKNQILVLKAMLEIENEHLHYFLAGIGENEPDLKRFVEEYNLVDRVHFLGYRRDLAKLHYALDLNVFPSFREGLALGGLESVVDGMYILGSDVRGIKDYILDDKIGKTFNPNGTATDLAKLIKEVTAEKRRVPARVILNELMAFDSVVVDEKMALEYKMMLKKGEGNGN